MQNMHTVSDGTFCIIPKGETLVSDFGKISLGDKAYRIKLPSLNMNTLRKIRDKMKLIF